MTETVAANTAAVFDGGNQDYCSAAVAPGTRVRDYEGKLGFLAVEFAQPVAVSGFTMGVKGSCTWDMPTAFVFQGSSDGTSWQDLADVQGPLIWDPSEKKDLSKSNPQKTKELQGKLAAWQKSMKAKMPVPNPNYDPQAPAKKRKPKKK